MRPNSFRSGCLWLSLAMLYSPHIGVAEESTNASASAEPAMSQKTEYNRQLEEFLLARQQFDATSDSYWNLITQKRLERIAKRHSRENVSLDNYVLTQPPIYSGPSQPVDPAAPTPQQVPPIKNSIPVVTDFLKFALDHFRFIPQRPESEIEFKRAYAATAAAAGITREQAVRIYAFEAGGDGRYDVQAGLEHPAPGAQAVSTALGYNQLLVTNSVGLIAEKGDQFIESLTRKGSTLSGDSRKLIEHKILVLRSMVDFARTVPNKWSEHEKLARTPQGLGIHALNLDIDLGPLLQTQKLFDSIIFARKNGYNSSPLSAAELEMMNLTGDGNGFDMITMPLEMRPLVPTSNYFQRTGYERNPVAARNNVVSALLAATNAIMDRESKLPGARDLFLAFPDQ